MKSITLLAVVLLVACPVTLAVPISSITANDMISNFSTSNGNFGLGEISVEDDVEIIIEDTSNDQTTIPGGSFTLTSSLKEDNSGGDLARGYFEQGTITFLDSGDNILLEGSIISLELAEAVDGAGVLSGAGIFDVEQGSLTGDFAMTQGRIVDVTFEVTPAGFSDFSQNFTGRSNITVIPIPEPATVLLFGSGGLFLLYSTRRRKSA